MIKIYKQIAKRFKKRQFSKRVQLVLVTIILTLGLMAAQLASFEERGLMIVGLSILSLFLSAWALRENLKGVKWITLLILPPFFSMAVGFFYFLLPVRWLTRLPFAGLFALGMYALLLTENIYNVATERSIGLLRVGQSVGLLLTLITYFLLIQTILSFHFPSVLNFILIFIFSYFLTLQSLWSVGLGEKFKKETLYSSVISLSLAELVFIFSFWPVKLTVEALFLTTVFYVLIAATQQYLLGRFFKKTINELLTVLLAVFLLLIVTTSWR
ncbi:hypothetical protein ISS85_00245 [Candidatus Microgenomates bacterium]|nr:hypothetical protein [Candidatus Microgenomates bacterium]